MCVNCTKSYTSKENLQKHYGYEKVKVDGKLVKNKCFNSKSSNYGTSEKEKKKCLKNQKSIFHSFKKNHCK